MNRQVFFANRGYDTHGGQLRSQRLLNDLSRRSCTSGCHRSAWIADRVTTFTLSEFGRTYKPATNGGTDHGWGNYPFVVGGAVKGGDFYGTLPVRR